MKTKLFVAVILIMLIQCKPDYRNEIIFSCIYCHGCVERALREIEAIGLDENYTIILDTNCYAEMIDTLKINYIQMTEDQITKRYGRFGNFLAIDSSGRKKTFLTDKDLMRDFILKIR